MTVLITRAMEDATPLAQLLAEKGVATLIDPLLTIEPVARQTLDLAGVQALLVTSANGVRALAVATSERNLPVYAVGDATMREANALGFETVNTASGDVDALVDLVLDKVPAKGGTLLHCAGTKVAGDLAKQLEAAGYSYRREVLYHAVATDHLKSETLSAIQNEQVACVMLYSPRTAAIFCACVQRAGCQPALTKMTAFCLSPAVADQAGMLNWASIETAKTPTQKSLLEIVLEWV